MGGGMPLCDGEVTSVYVPTYDSIPTYINLCEVHRKLVVR